jgi:hypothetical protein
MNDLERFPSLHVFGERLAELADRDASRTRRLASAELAILGRFVPAARLAAILGAIIALVSGAYAVPPTRAAVSSLYDSTLAHWLSDDVATPGRPAAEQEDLPDWLASEQLLHGKGNLRVLAEANGDQLVVLRQGQNISLGVADFSQTSPVDDLRQELSGQQIRLLAPGRFVPNGRHDLRPIFGLVSGSVTRIQLNYADRTSPAIQDHLKGAFGLTIETNRRPLSLTAYDAAGRLIARKTFVPHSRHATSAADLVGDFRYCATAAGCPAWSR